MNAVASQYSQPPYSFKVLGNENNYQIARAMTWLLGNATNDIVLFLEKDFQLVEPLPAVVHQLNTGVNMIKVNALDRKRKHD